MAIECYALVVTEVLPTGGKKYWGSLDTDPAKAGIEHHFCHLRLVQPVGSNNRVPKPRWEIVKDHLTLSEYDASRARLRYTTEDGSDVVGALFAYWDGERVPLLLSYPVFSSAVNYKAVAFVESKQIRLNQIRSLFPETETMPFSIALDYVRDRI